MAKETSLASALSEAHPHKFFAVQVVDFGRHVRVVGSGDTTVDATVAGQLFIERERGYAVPSGEDGEEVTLMVGTTEQTYDDSFIILENLGKTGLKVTVSVHVTVLCVEQ